MGRHLRACLALLLALFLCLIPKVEATETLKVGYVPGTGFLEEDSPGHIIGPGYEYMEFLSDSGTGISSTSPAWTGGMRWAS